MIIEAERPVSRVVNPPKIGVRQVPLMSEGDSDPGRTPSTPLVRPRPDDGYTGPLSRLPGGSTYKPVHDAERMQGTLLRQRYHLLSQVGKGGFGIIYKAVDTRLGNRIVAIKQLNRKSIAAHKYTAAIEAFKREALILAHLVHPNLPRVYDFFSEGGCWYLVMDFIEGETLEAYLYRWGGKLPLEQVLQIGIRLCTVLQFLHTRPSPIIYRDLKPANVMLTRDGYFYLIDFGIARFFKPGQAQDTAVFGTPGYTAPEQYGQAQTTPSADIYSLGATLHRLLTGQNPKETPFHFAPLHLANRSPAADLEHLIGRMVDMDADKRPATVQIIKQQLQQIAERQKHQRKVATHRATSSNKRSSDATDRGPLPIRDALFLFLSGSAFAGITASLLWILRSML
jgi:serine/threonine protein kinase